MLDSHHDHSLDSSLDASRHVCATPLQLFFVTVMSSSVAKPPVLEIQCLLVWESTSCVFRMSIETKDNLQGNDTTVDLLKRRIHADPSLLPSGIPLHHLSLYRVSIDLDDQESLPKTILKCTERQNIMNDHRTITEYFPVKLDARRLHVLVDYIGRRECSGALPYL